MDATKCEAFLLAADTGSLTAAAAQMGYSQSGITRMIESLENEVGFRLFVRSKKGVVLTENGREMLPVLRAVVHSSRSAEQLGADIRGSICGSLTIGSYYSISANLMPSILCSFQKKYPGITVRIQEGSNLEMAVWLSERSVDLNFCARPDLNDIDWIPLIKDEIVMWLPQDHPLSHAGSYPVRRLETETTFIHTSPGRDTELDRLISKEKLHIRPLFTTKDGYTTYNMVEAGLGISFNQKLISRRWSGNVREISFDPPQFMELGIALPSRESASPTAIRFISCVKEVLSENNKAKS